MKISDFKAQCIAVLKRVQETGEGVVVTLRGTPVARVEPVRAEGGKRLGELEGTMKVSADLVRRGSTADWEMLK